MEGSPVRGHERLPVTRLSESRDLESFQAELIRILSSELPHAEIFFGLFDQAGESSTDTVVGTDRTWTATRHCTRSWNRGKWSASATQTKTRRFVPPPLYGSSVVLIPADRRKCTAGCDRPRISTGWRHNLRQKKSR